MPSPIYQNMVNLIVGFPIWRRPSIFMNVAMREQCTLDLKFLDVAKVTTLISTVITNFVQTFITNWWFKNAFLAVSGIEIS
jgi:hypothetical protein